MVFFVFRIGNHTNFSQYFQTISAAKHLKLAPFGTDPFEILILYLGVGMTTEWVTERGHHSKLINIPWIQ